MKAPKTVLVFDLQGLQTTSFDRGMGRYSRYLLKSLKSLILGKKFSQVAFLLNSTLPEEHVIADLKELILEHYQIIRIELPYKEANVDNLASTQDVIDGYFTSTYSKYLVTYLMLSNFELGQALSVFPTNSVKILLFYDLIPLLFSQEYLTNQQIYDDYFYRFRNVFKSDLILTISQTTKNDLHTYLNLPGSRVFNIGGGSISKSTKGQKLPMLDNIKPYFLFPSGENWRKNNENTILAFQKFNKENKYSLVITSNFSEIGKNNLKKDDPNIIFTNHVTDSQLSRLYINCIGVVFPSIYEGLGLPVLEAIEHKKIVLLSDIPVFREFEHSHLIWCDPNNISSISEGFTQIISNRSPLYESFNDKFSWSHTSSEVIKILSKPIQRINHKNIVKRIALVGPDPQSYSAIGKFCQELMPYLSELANVDFYFERPVNAINIRPSYCNYVWNCSPVKDLIKNLNKYDEVIYNVGNSVFHIQTLFLALLHPSTLILHDINLSELTSLMNNIFPNWIERNRLEEILEKIVVKGSKAQCVTTLINNQTKVICHSNFAFVQLSAFILNQNTSVIQSFLPSQHPVISYRNHSKLNIAVSGHISKDKGLNDLTKIFHDYSDKYNFFVFGHTSFDQTYNELRELAANQFINFSENVTDYEFESLLEKTDFLINLRPNYHGEASKTVLEAMRHGVIPIVTNIGWFSELPNELILRVDNIDDIIKLLSDDKQIHQYIKAYSFKTAESFLSETDYYHYSANLLSK